MLLRIQWLQKDVFSRADRYYFFGSPPKEVLVVLRLKEGKTPICTKINIDHSILFLEIST
jgi:hypothetical protein